MLASVWCNNSTVSHGAVTYKREKRLRTKPDADKANTGWRQQFPQTDPQNPHLPLPPLPPQVAVTVLFKGVWKNNCDIRKRRETTSQVEC